MKECEDRVLDFIKKYTPQGKCPLGGNSVGQVRNQFIIFTPFRILRMII
jgi:oligoribonuclease (3'-5' exoribonuclease)